ncbi:hypothetical protein DM80_5998 [Burkholderia multivorans]|nr:hypothetical protein DM80_5998 [Burkholderia multivorans]
MTVPLLDDMKWWFEATLTTLSAKSDATKASLRAKPLVGAHLLLQRRATVIDSLIAELALGRSRVQRVGGVRMRHPMGLARRSFSASAGLRAFIRSGISRRNVTNHLPQPRLIPVLPGCVARCATLRAVTSGVAGRLWARTTGSPAPSARAAGRPAQAPARPLAPISPLFLLPVAITRRERPPRSTGHPRRFRCGLRACGQGFRRRSPTACLSVRQSARQPSSARRVRTAR